MSCSITASRAAAKNPFKIPRKIHRGSIRSRSAFAGPLLIALVLVLVSVRQVSARDCRVNLLPNGNKFSCLACHTSSTGVVTNAFGKAIQPTVGGSCTKQFWTPALAARDSDGDGLTNGQELGDPDGTWKPGDPDPGDPAKLTNPGVKNVSPKVTSVDPSELSTLGGTAVNIHGTSFQASTIIKIGAKELAGQKFVSSTLITGAAPAMEAADSPGPRDITASDARGTSTLAGGVTYVVPPPLVLISVEPEEVSTFGGTKLTIHGKNLRNDTVIWIGSRALEHAHYIDGTLITGEAPAAPPAESPGPQDVVAMDDRGSAVIAAAVVYVKPAGVAFIRGDFDSDQEVGLSDAVAMLSFLFDGRSPSTCAISGDANGDGLVDISDPIAVLLFLFYGGRRPAAPFPACGVDEGAVDCQGSSACP